MSWNHEQVLSLIELYKTRPCLYEVKNTAYKNKHLRNAAYEEIQAELQPFRTGTTIPEIKAKINGLRTNLITEHRKHVKSVKSGAGDDEIYQPTLWYYESLKFILEHVTPRAAIDSINTTNNESILQNTDDEMNSQDVDVDDYDYEGDESIIFEYVDDSEDSTLPARTSVSQVQAPSLKVPAKEPPRRKRKTSDDAIIISANQTLQKLTNVIQSNTTQNIGNQQNDHLKVFGDFVVSRLRLLKNPNVVNAVLEKITHILFEASRS